MFDQPPVSIEKGMEGVDSKRKKRNIIIAAVIAVLVVAIAACAIAFAVAGGSSLPFLQAPATSSTQDDGSASGSDANGSGASGSSGDASSAGSGSAAGGDSASGADSGSGAAAGSGSGSGSGAAGSESSNSDLSGEVTYTYTATTAAGKEYAVEDVVTFGADGDCLTSRMRMTFSDESTAKSFTDSLMRQYKTKMTLESLDGAVAVALIDASDWALSRDEYESALRYSSNVKDLNVYK